MTLRRLILFDIDGTILLTSGAGRRAITAALAEVVGASDAFGRIRFDGKTDPQIVTEMLASAGDPGPHPPERVRSLCERYVTLLERELAVPVGVTLMPGVPRILDRLEAEGDVMLGLLTGNLERGAALKLRAAGLDPGRFKVGAYGSDSPERPDLPPIAARRAEPFFGRPLREGEVVIIGDTPADIACGAGIRARAIGVATGSYSVAQLEACNPHAVFADLADTERALEAILA